MAESTQRPDPGRAGALEQRLAAGDWLRVGEVAYLLEVSRATAHRMVRDGTIRHRLVPGTGRHRECHPDDVRRALQERREVHGADD